MFYQEGKRGLTRQTDLIIEFQVINSIIIKIQSGLRAGICAAFGETDG